MHPSKRPRTLLPATHPPEPPRSPPNLSKPKRELVKAACQSCRKRKAKCDGRRPTCRPCAASNIQCLYSVPEGMSTRESQRRQLERVTQNNVDLRTVLDVLRQMSGPDSADAMRRIREANSLDEAVAMISDAVLLIPGASPTEAAMPGFELPASPRTPRPRVQVNELPTLPLSRWTSVSQDDRYLTHLLRLFWTWDTSLVHLLDREMFLEELKARNRPVMMDGLGEELFCSEFLVNCILAVASFYAIRDPKAINVYPQGRHFADDAARVFQDQGGQPSLTTLQGLAFLWVFEASSGNYATSMRLLNEVLRMYSVLQLQDEAAQTLYADFDPEVYRRRQTIPSMVWGFYCLGLKMGLAYSQPSQIDRPEIKIPHDPDGPILIASPSSMPQDALLWTPYPIPAPERLSMSREAFSANCKLAELGSAALSCLGLDMDGADRTPNFEQLRRIYILLLEWKATVSASYQPSTFALPNFVSIFVTFDMIALKLLEPCLRHPFPRPNSPSGHTRSILHASSLMSNIWAYRITYGHRNDYWLLQGCFAAATAMAIDLEPGSVQVDTFTKACLVLYQAGEHLQLANQLLLTILSSLTERDTPIPGQLCTIFSAVRARVGKIRLKGVRLALPTTLGAVMPGADLIAGSMHDVVFSNLIMTTELEGLRHG